MDDTPAIETTEAAPVDAPGRRRKPGPAPLAPILLTDVQVAQRLSCSRSQVHVMRSTGQLPRPLKLAGLTRWREAEIIAWVNAGCPNIDDWSWPGGRDAS